jgi:hypothetical protein
MAYYTDLIAAWNGATQPPAGCVGTAITGGMTTAQKIAAVNSWTVTATIPAQYTITGAQLDSCINAAEFLALTEQEQQNINALIDSPGPLSVGSSTAELALLTDGEIIAYFPAGGKTITALSALAPGAQSWWSTPVANGGGGLTSSVSAADATAAGLS